MNFWVRTNIWSRLFAYFHERQTRRASEHCCQIVASSIHPGLNTPAVVRHVLQVMLSRR